MTKARDAADDRVPALPAAGIGNGNGAGDVGAADLDVERSARARGGDAHLEHVVARGHVRRVREPFTGRGPADVIASTDGLFRIDAFLEAAGAAPIGGVAIVVTDAFAAVVEILGLERPGSQSLGVTMGVARAVGVALGADVAVGVRWPRRSGSRPRCAWLRPRGPTQAGRWPDPDREYQRSGTNGLLGARASCLT